MNHIQIVVVSYLTWVPRKLSTLVMLCAGWLVWPLVGWFEQCWMLCSQYNFDGGGAPDSRDESALRAPNAWSILDAQLASTFRAGVYQWTPLPLFCWERTAFPPFWTPFTLRLPIFHLLKSKLIPTWPHWPAVPWNTLMHHAFLTSWVIALAPFPSLGRFIGLLPSQLNNCWHP